MGITLDASKKIHISKCIAKSKEAFDDAEFNFQNRRFSVTLNRIYYSIYYSVLALADIDGYVSSKPIQLKGWFNKKYIYEENVFDERMLMIYQKAYIDHQESEYEIIAFNELEIGDIEKSLHDTKYFIESVYSYINSLL